MSHKSAVHGVSVLPMNSPWPVAWPKSKKPSSYGDKDSERIILHLHRKEMELRRDIWKTQVVRWTPAQIRKVYG